MSPKTPSSVKGRDTAFLYVSEILHRIRSEYSRAISFASILTKKSNNQETKEALRNNSFRHAFATRSGRIEVSLIVSDNLVLCNVSDNGLAAAPVAAGVGCASRGTGRRGRTAFPRRRGISYSLISDRSVDGSSFRREPRCKFATL
jgi:hypothetical protein